MRKQLLKSFFEKISEGDFEVKYWDGEEVRYGTGIPRVKLVFHKPLPLSFNLEDPVLSFGEAYMDEIIDFEGSLEEIIRIAELNKHNFTSNGLKGKAFSAIKTLGGAAARLKQKQNIRHHYDLGNDFFSLWLDETMSYSCAYFKTPQDSLHQAQIQKIDHILKKMQLQPGERLLDIGSGWGWLIIRAAQQYGVRALGITISEEQFRATKERISQLGLSDRVEVKLLDYLDLDEKEYQFDKIVSVGMFEHVGKENLPVYMEKVNKLLVPGGLSLLHTISGVNENPVNSWIDTYIFPGGYIPSLRETVWLLPEYDFHTLHIESLRMHYAMTLDRWYENFCNHIADVEEKFGRRFVRMWSLYLRSCAASFRTSGLDVYQMLFSKGLNNSLPLTLEQVYA
ncbi:SAM-dependent methyltransferase [Desulfotruncus alcoholivorax]|uniref:SAM-dependent methyltransferase n=1 Tax=Desulfotruncus alcoholivorax TaxID=265477 RepID=UPI000420A47F|nr:cyclopropane-fatty-acyl-phospholipid synthase family protein [Desulfotruncus alcoholivorax]